MSLHSDIGLPEEHRRRRRRTESKSGLSRWSLLKSWLWPKREGQISLGVGDEDEGEDELLHGGEDDARPLSVEEAATASTNSVPAPAEIQAPSEAELEAEEREQARREEEEVRRKRRKARKRAKKLGLLADNGAIPYTDEISVDGESEYMDGEGAQYADYGEFVQYKDDPLSLGPNPLLINADGTSATIGLPSAFPAEGDDAVPDIGEEMFAVRKSRRSGRSAGGSSTSGSDSGRRRRKGGSERSSDSGSKRSNSNNMSPVVYQQHQYPLTNPAEYPLPDSPATCQTNDMPPPRRRSKHKSHSSISSSSNQSAPSAASSHRRRHGTGPSRLNDQKYPLSPPQAVDEDLYSNGSAGRTDSSYNTYTSSDGQLYYQQHQYPLQQGHPLQGAYVQDPTTYHYGDGTTVGGEQGFQAGQLMPDYGQPQQIQHQFSGPTPSPLNFGALQLNEPSNPSPTTPSSSTVEELASSDGPSKLQEPGMDSVAFLTALARTKRDKSQPQPTTEEPPTGPTKPAPKILKKDEEDEGGLLDRWEGLADGMAKGRKWDGAGEVDGLEGDTWRRDEGHVGHHDDDDDDEDD